LQISVFSFLGALSANKQHHRHANEGGTTQQRTNDDESNGIARQTTFAHAVARLHIVASVGVVV